MNPLVPQPDLMRRIFALFALETLIADGLPLPAPLRHKLEVPSHEFAATLESMSEPERTTLLRAIADEGGLGQLAGPLKAWELLMFIDGLPLLPSEGLLDGGTSCAAPRTAPRYDAGARTKRT